MIYPMQPFLDQSRSFLSAPSPLPKLVVVYGPTACGKTGLAIELAKMLGGEIVGADSRQIYRYMDIGTGKVSEDERQEIQHHMIDIANPDEVYSVGQYQQTVVPLIREIAAHGNIPILCGGTGLYIDAVTRHFDIPEGEPDWEYRNELEGIKLEHGNERLWNMLAAVDPEYAAELHPNSHRYVARALEVIRKTGSSKREIKSQKDPLFDTLFLTPYDGDRAKLYDRINERVRDMFDAGLVEETRDLLARGYGRETP